MSSYLLQLSYTTDAWAALIKHPENRVDAVRKVVEKLGGKVGAFWASFGDYDLVGILEMPDNISAAAFAVAVAGGGACRNVKTTPLLSLAEALEAMKKAGKSGYKPVTSKR
jgi:uncharacterized protein with GYD domain